jgi:Flp pilus assembly protein TadB
MTPGQSGRFVAKAMIVLTAILGFVVAPFLYVASPGGVEPMFAGPAWRETALVGIAITGFLIGFVWMIRIYRSDPEPDQKTWRYREWD